ncbi:tetratricopeptide repeat protein [Fusibacter paucivorans]|uniref:Tetratricopeptide repeat protein n=1 Tax=Fusibacter paucivorans TaxID=76009 RepID=A0ABS5PU70_9FIRM|nr:tetratricopeptide repeat protein [Fusibacter paucivorans]MBS7528710.1 tetratricopeptide repeat protein [Fusibacter paucivorans]
MDFYEFADYFNVYNDNREIGLQVLKMKKLFKNEKYDELVVIYNALYDKLDEKESCTLSWFILMGINLYELTGSIDNIYKILKSLEFCNSECESEILYLSKILKYKIGYILDNDSLMNRILKELKLEEHVYFEFSAKIITELIKKDELTKAKDYLNELLEKNIDIRNINIYEYTDFYQTAIELLLMLWDLEKALNILNDIIKICEDNYGEDHMRTINMMSLKGRALESKGQYDEAIALYEKVAEKRLTAYGEDYPSLWTTWNNLAGALESKGQYDTAIALYEKVAEKMLKTYGEDYPSLWTTWNNLALALSSKGQYDSAIALYEKVVGKMLKTYGEDYPELWKMWVNLASTLSSKGQYDQAIALYEKVAEKMSKTYGENYPELWTTWHNLAVCQHNKSKYLSQIEEFSNELKHRLKSLKIYKTLLIKQPDKFLKNYKVLLESLISVADKVATKDELDFIENEYVAILNEYE